MVTFSYIWLELTYCAYVYIGFYFIQSSTKPEKATSHNNGNVALNNEASASDTASAPQQSETVEDVNSQWETRISRSRKIVYYYNRATKESTWDLPPGVDPSKIKGYGEITVQQAQNINPLEGGAGQIRASHLLVKHMGSRRPSSWKEVSFYQITNSTRYSCYSVCFFFFIKILNETFFI